MKNLLLMVTLLSLVSCGGKMLHWQNGFIDTNGDGGGTNGPTPEQIVEAVLPDLADKEGCETVFPEGVDDVLAIITCDSGEEYIIDNNGNVTVGTIDDVEPTPENTPENDDDSDQNSDDNSDDGSEGSNGNNGNPGSDDDDSDTDSDDDQEQEEEEEEQYVCNPADNFIVNGSFEEGHGLGNNKWGLYSELPGWYAMLDKRNAAIEIQNGDRIGGIAASDGSAKLELDAHNKNGYTMSDAMVAQDISVPRKGIYKLTFDYSPRVVGKRATNRVNVKFNGKKVAKLVGKERGWKTVSVYVKVRKPQKLQRLIFKGRKDQDTLGGYIDNVSLTPVCHCIQ